MTSLPDVGFAEAAPLYQARGLNPIPVLGKKPVPSGATGELGTVTAQKILEWSADPKWAGQNTALRHEGTIGIDVDEYGDKHGAAQLAELEAQLGSLPVTISSTARGIDSPSRQHFYRLPDPTVVLLGKAAPDVDIIQRHHRYAVVAPSRHPETGEPYCWYGYEGEPLTGFPSIDDFETLPQAWVDHFTVAPVDVDHSGFAGSIEEWVETTEDGAPSAKVREWLNTVPLGNFGHDEMTKLSYNLVRLGAEGESGIRTALTTLYAAWLRFPYDTPEYRKGIDDAVRSAISKAGARETKRPLIQYAEAQTLLEGRTPSRSDWGVLLTQESERSVLMAECFAVGLDATQTASIIWGSYCGQPLYNDPDGLQTLWAEVDEFAASMDVSGPAPVVDLAPKRIELLTPEERAEVEGDYDWFGYRYLEWVRSRVSAVNAPYHRMYVWLILALRFSDMGFLPLKGMPIAPIFFAFQVGPTTSGKSEAMALGRSVIRACFPEDHPIISANASANALVEHLIERDGQATLMNTDEAAGVLAMMSTPGHWMAGVRDQILALFDGEVSMILRAGKKDISGKDAKSFFSTNFVGTVEGVADVLNEDFWVSGFGPRSIWAIGESLDDPDADVAVEAENYSPGMYDEFPKQWAAEFSLRRNTLKGLGTLPLPVHSDKASLQRQTKLQKQLTKIAKGHRHEALLKPTLIRLGTTIRKAAILVAMSEGRSEVTMHDRLIAIEAGEEWLNNIIFMVSRTTASAESREVDKIETFIASRHNQEARPADIYSFSSKLKWDTDRYINQLEAEERITAIRKPDGSVAWRAIERKAA